MKISIHVLIIVVIINVILTSVIQQTAYAENKAKEWCSGYNGKWDNGKCKFKDIEDQADYEDDLCYDEEDAKKYPKICDPDYD